MKQRSAKWLGYFLLLCLMGISVCVYGSEEKKVLNGVVTDGRIITGRGPGLSISFGLAILAYLKGDKAADEVKSGMML